MRAHRYTQRLQGLMGRTELLLFGFALSLPACFEGIPDGPALDDPQATSSAFFSCEPGEAIPCTCLNGAAGEQVCASSGAEASQCACAPQPDPTAASTTLPPLPGDESSTGAEDTSGNTGSSTSSDGDVTSSTSGSGTSDSGTSDSGTSDSGTSDSGTSDSGTSSGSGTTAG